MEQSVLAAIKTQTAATGSGSGSGSGGSGSGSGSGEADLCLYHAAQIKIACDHIPNDTVWSSLDSLVQSGAISSQVRQSWFKKSRPKHHRT